VEQLYTFLLYHGIHAEFYQSEYGKYWQDAMFGSEKLDSFEPDIIYIHTSWRNITSFPLITDTVKEVDSLLENEFNRFEMMWHKLEEKFLCPIIQNNFDRPNYRLMGNRDIWDYRGRSNYISRLNQKFYEYAQSHDNFYINDLEYISQDYGLSEWNNSLYWHMYKYALAVPAIPTLAYNISNIIKAIYGKNKKSLVLDLDNTLWGGIVGDDGVENIIIGEDTSEAQVYSEFQRYLKDIKSLGVILNINSKNDKENALAGLNHPDGILRPNDFIVIKANWEPKSKNIQEIADELNIGVDSLVFIDDNPAERAIINQYIPNVSTPDIQTPEKYIEIIDRSGYFEVTNISKDDLKKSEMYKENIQRNQALSSFQNYDDYLKSLKMCATIENFIPVYMARIAQLTNKSNQFNLTTHRYTQAEIEEIANNKNYIKLYGKLEDIFGDNGVVTVVIGHIEEKVLHIDLWLMSCRVLKRDMEFAMMDELVKRAKEKGIETIKGFYYPTAKNNMVRNFYEWQGFTKVKEDEEGNTIWELDLNKEYVNKNQFIKIEE